MNKKTNLLLAVGLVLIGINSATTFAATSASQTPLYSAVPGAKPNIMLALDNSGSMAFEYPDSYAVTDKCTDPSNRGSSCYGLYGWFSMRSSDVNRQYYNPSSTYHPRVDADGKPQTNPLTFVDNQASGSFNFDLYNAPADNNLIPLYTEYQGTASSSAKFTYVRCKNGDCSSSSNRTQIDITPTGPASIPLPSGHARTDCGSNATSCTQKQELQNILNWYYWYRSRSLAVGTAVGQALQGYENKFRIGYLQYNVTKYNYDWRGNFTKYSGSTASSIVRGVRYFRDDTTNAAFKWKSELYTWLYGIIPAGGTPSHQAVSLAADYYSGTNTYANSSDARGKFGNPWKNDPTSTSAESNTQDLSCRRSFAIVLSDGAWNSNTSKNAGTQYASTDGAKNFSGTPRGISMTLKYSPDGATGWNDSVLAKRLKARDLYIPYSDNKASSYGLADLTADLFWNRDFSSILDNNVPPLDGQHNPTFWQNMTTYTIGWGLTPSGDVNQDSSRLTWAQINAYNNDWLSGKTSVTQPKWATGNLNTTSSDERRVDDFIRAGFTGGGRAYSVYSGDDVRRALDNALSSMVGSGNDAGVAVSGNSSEFQTLENQFKYTTEYQTADNSGDIKAFQLNANGGYLNVDSSGNPVVAWSANAKMPAVSSRKIFALSNYDPNLPTTATRVTMGYNNTLSQLPTDFQTLFNSNGQQDPSKTNFIRYLLGEDPQADKDGTVYRVRKQPIGASVNSPPVFVGGRINMGYDTIGSVNGGNTYANYRTLKTTLPPTIFAATNNGKVHVIDASKTAASAGTELAEFMPKGSMAAQVDLASPAFRFRYTLDGPLVEHDIYGGAVAGQTGWRQLVFGTGGRAGPFMYGLQSPMNATDRQPVADNFLWEVNAQTDGYGDMGNITNNPTAGQLDDGTWVMLSTTGHYPAAGKNVGLYVVEALTGKLKKFIPLPAGYGTDAAGGNRGIGGVVAVRDTTRRIVAAYAGDANGNLWRFDLRTSKFVVSYGKPLFTTPEGKKQPIYATPTWQVHPGNSSSCSISTTTQCGAIVVIGTGILLDEDDLAKPATRQAIYGIWDQTPIGGDDKPSLATISVSNLVEQTIDLASSKKGTGLEANKDFYQVSSNAVDWKTKLGWYVKLGVIPYTGVMDNGERVVGDLSNLGSSVLITSFLPEDRNLGIESCTATGSLPNIIYALDALTGKNKFSYDVDANGSFDFYSIVMISAGGFTRGTVSSRNLIGQPNEGRPDLKADTDCTNETGYLTGVGGTQKVGDGCSAPKTWRRSWRTVVNPPF